MGRAIIYARFSTAMQSSLSIEDQVRVCSQLVERQGWTVADVQCDAAISGAVRNRPGLNALMAAAEAGDVDFIVAESLDRLSRDQEDIAAIFKRLCYRGVVIWTLSEGEISELHVGLRGTMAAMVRKDAADKVKRGLTGRALAGSNPGGMAYGYRKVPRFDARGEPIRGLRAIDEDQAAVIRRIFDLTARGLSARSIAALLNREGVPGPTGGPWRASTIAGDAARRNGILKNDLYRGKLIYNRTRRVYRPGDHRREIRLNPESEWTIVDVPDMRIVDDALWATVQARRTGSGGGPRRRPAKRLLSGKGVCGECGGSWIVVGTERWGCSRHHDGRLCGNGRTITTAAFERRVLAGLSDRLLDPDLVAIFVDEWRARRKARLREEAKERGRMDRKKADAQRRVVRLVDAIADGTIDKATARDALAAAKADVAAADQALAELASEKVVALHPGLADDYRRRVRQLAETLKSDDPEEATAALRALIDRVVVVPKTDRIGVALEVQGLLTTALQVAAGQMPQSVCSTWCPRSDTGQTIQFLKVAC